MAPISFVPADSDRQVIEMGYTDRQTDNNKKGSSPLNKLFVSKYSNICIHVMCPHLSSSYEASLLITKAVV